MIQCIINVVSGFGVFDKQFGCHRAVIGLPVVSKGYRRKITNQSIAELELFLL